MCVVIGIAALGRGPPANRAGTIARIDDAATELNRTSSTEKRAPRFNRLLPYSHRMGAASQYARSFGHVTLRAHRSIQAAFGAVTLAAAAVTGWRFGTAWGTATALGCLFAIAVYTGVSIQERLNEASNSAGTRIPTGWSAIVDGGLRTPLQTQPQFPETPAGVWLPPGVKVISQGPGPVTDDMHNTVAGRVWYRAGRSGNTLMD